MTASMTASHLIKTSVRNRVSFYMQVTCMYVYVYIYSSDMDIYKNYTVIMKIIIYSVEISSPCS